MPTAKANGVSLYYELAGDAGPPLVLVHGSWGDHETWSAVVPALSRRFRVLTYDRRGHSRSERPAGQGSVHEDVDDLAALIEQLDLAPAHVVGSSFGAAIVLRLAVRRPDLFLGLSIHEPPLIAVLAGDPRLAPLAAPVQAQMRSISDQLASGDVQGGARRFMEEIALGPGAWESLPAAARQTFVANAPTWLDECRDPDAYALDLRELAGVSAPAFLTQGGQSAPFFLAIMDRVAAALPQARRFTFEAAGHVPQITHPDAFAGRMAAFLE